MYTYWNTCCSAPCLSNSSSARNADVQRDTYTYIYTYIYITCICICFTCCSAPCRSNLNSARNAGVQRTESSFENAIYIYMYMYMYIYTYIYTYVASPAVVLPVDQILAPLLTPVSIALRRALRMLPSSAHAPRDS